MTKPPIITPKINKTPSIEGQEYYYLSFDKGYTNTKFHKGTCSRCEKCNRACVTNSVTITSFGNKSIDVPVQKDMCNALEIYYNESVEMCLCEDCCN